MTAGAGCGMEGFPVGHASGMTGVIARTNVTLHLCFVGVLQRIRGSNGFDRFEDKPWGVEPRESSGASLNPL
jgi:hypothetical protein